MSIIFEKENQLLILETKNTSYQMKINDIGILLHTYYGPKLQSRIDMSYQIPELDRGFSGNPYEKRDSRGYSLDLFPQEYTSTGVGDYRISSILLSTANGSQSADFRYVSHEIVHGKYVLPELPQVRNEENEAYSLKIILADKLAGLELQLIYSVFAEKDIITRSAVLHNIGENDIRINKASSICMDFLNQNLDVIHFHGRHCMERKPDRLPVDYQTMVIDTKRGMSSHHHNPFVILCDKNTTEAQGCCYGFMMVYSGNHKTEIEREQFGGIRLIMGLQDQSFEWKLSPDESFYTPEVILTFSDKGLNALSANYHKIIRENICPSRYLNERRPILINNWEATYFDFNYDKIMALANKAKTIGIEMLVLDDGWFGARNDDNAGLGDWFVNTEKLNGGLRKLSQDIHAIGLKFGLWFEPEMVNEDSNLYRSHPEWALTDPERKPMLGRNQMVLDMSNSLVRDYLFDSISDVLNSAEIDYIKWDFNRPVSNAYSNALPADQQGEVSHRFILGTYELLGRIRTAFPDVMIEGCAGGGGRFDAGMLYYSPQIWCSDNTDPISRLAIQKGTSYGYPVSTMGSHVSASPNHQTGRTTPLQTRGIVAMSGTFGYELDLEKLSDAEIDEMKMQIESFKKYYWLIQKGTYYRLDDNRSHDFYESWAFVAPDQSEVLLNIVLTDLHANSEVPWVKLEGLDADGIYQLSGTDQQYTGDALMYCGFGRSVCMKDYESMQFHLKKIK